MASLRYSVENALKGYLEETITTATIYTGLDYSDKTTPAIICKAVSAEEEPLHSGNYRLLCAIEIRDIASSSSIHDTLCEAVRNAICIPNDELAGQLEAEVAALQVWGVSAPHRMEWSTDEDCWVETQFVEIYCAPSALTGP